MLWEKRADSEEVRRYWVGGGRLSDAPYYGWSVVKPVSGWLYEILGVVDISDAMWVTRVEISRYVRTPVGSQIEVGMDLEDQV